MLKSRKMMKKNASGFGLIEVVIAASILSATVFSLLAVFIISNRLSMEASDRIRANFLAEEGIEAMRFLRDKSWGANFESLTPGTDYYLSFDAGTSVWSIVTADPGLIDGLFRRKVNVQSVSRDSNADIVTSGGTVDPETKKITVSIYWQERYTTPSVGVSTYLSNIFSN
ncbi:hypothetical protein HYW53_03650 [Candidatus Giovannonibacteria bacterium]|nr:hypothetical protein [Candidatus Giovannonibacteria bacterium]